MTLLKFPADPSSNYESDLGPIASAETKSDTLTLGDMDAATFFAQNGDTIVVLAGTLSSALDPQLELYAPDGSIVGEPVRGGYSARIHTTLAAGTGTYTIVCRDDGGNQTAEYGLTLVRLHDRTDGGPLPSETTVNDRITLGDMDAYTFWGTGCQNVVILMGTSSSALDPQVELYAPDGSMVGDPVSGGSSATLRTTLPPQTGTYTVICRDDGGTQTGDYATTMTITPFLTLGDVNGDGAILANDASLALQLSVGLPVDLPPGWSSECQWAVADVTGDDVLLGNDATLILRESIGLPVDFNHR